MSTTIKIKYATLYIHTQNKEMYNNYVDIPLVLQVNIN